MIGRNRHLDGEWPLGDWLFVYPNRVKAVGKPPMPTKTPDGLKTKQKHQQCAKGKKNTDSFYPPPRSPMGLPPENCQPQREDRPQTRRRRTPAWEEILAAHKTDGGFVSRICGSVERLQINMKTRRLRNEINGQRSYWMSERTLSLARQGRSAEERSLRTDKWEEMAPIHSTQPWWGWGGRSLCSLAGRRTFRQGPEGQ